MVGLTLLLSCLRLPLVEAQRGQASCMALARASSPGQLSFGTLVASHQSTPVNQTRPLALGMKFRSS
jgi:hypothetical protein